ncbi:MAG: P1 family peptidase [Dermatophilaceae bacterium]
MTSSTPVRAGVSNTLTDVAGIRVGHATRTGGGWLSGTSVVLAPAGGAVGGVDVRGGGPGTRETDLLDPRNVVERVHAVVLTGGSAYGLAAADGVMECLCADGVGFPVGPGPGQVVPIVPGAVIFDLGRGGDFGKRPGPGLGREAYAAADAGPVRQGACGAGTGAMVGGLKGAVGSASAVMPDGTTVGALVVVNATGSALDIATGELYAARFGLAGELPVVTGRAEELAEAARLAEPPGPLGSSGPESVLATTVGVVATDATLTKGQCAKVAGIAHDGLARAIRPVHTMLDGDTMFTMATGQRPPPDLPGLQLLLHVAGDCVTRAVGHAMLAAGTVVTPAATLRSYRDVFASAF